MLQESEENPVQISSEIRDQVYDEKQNTVIITVVCCSPERIMDKLCSKGRKTIKSIEIKDPAAKNPVKPKPDPAPAPAPSQPEKPKPKPNPAPVPVPVPVPVEKPQMKNNGSKNGSKSEPAPVPKPAEEPPKAAPPAPAPAPVAQWVPGYPPGPPPQAVCCGSCYEGRPGGPCYQGGYGPGPGFGYQYGRPSCPPGYYASRCDYFCEENPSACSIM